MSSKLVNKIRNKLMKEEIKLNERSASVCVIINDKDEILMIRRAEKKGDPWSNQMAFPGGKREAKDRSFRETAERECMEELGINLRKVSSFIGYMDKFVTHTGNMYVIPSVFYSRKRFEPNPNSEVSGYYWIRVKDLNERNKTNYVYQRDGEELATEAFFVNDCIIWGLSYRIILRLLELSGLRSAS